MEVMEEKGTDDVHNKIPVADPDPSAPESSTSTSLAGGGKEGQMDLTSGAMVQEQDPDDDPFEAVSPDQVFHRVRPRPLPIPTSGLRSSRSSDSDNPFDPEPPHPYQNIRGYPLGTQMQAFNLTPTFFSRMDYQNEFQDPEDDEDEIRKAEMAAFLKSDEYAEIKADPAYLRSKEKLTRLSQYYTNFVLDEEAIIAEMSPPEDFDFDDGDEEDEELNQMELSFFDNPPAPDTLPVYEQNQASSSSLIDPPHSQHGGIGDGDTSSYAPFEVGRPFSAQAPSSRSFWFDEKQCYEKPGDYRDDFCYNCGRYKNEGEDFEDEDNIHDEGGVNYYEVEGDDEFEREEDEEGDDIVEVEEADDIVEVEEADEIVEVEEADEIVEVEEADVDYEEADGTYEKESGDTSEKDNDKDKGEDCIAVGGGEFDEEVLDEDDKKAIKTNGGLKLLFSNLPPSLDEEGFLRILGPLEEYNYCHFCPYKKSLRSMNKTSMAYMNFVDPEFGSIIMEKFNGYLVHDRHGETFPMVVTAALYQGIHNPIRFPIKPEDNVLNGTIDERPEYEEFKTWFTTRRRKRGVILGETIEPVNPEQMLEDIEAEKAQKNNIVADTPLTEFLKTKKNEIEKELNQKEVPKLTRREKAALEKEQRRQERRKARKEQRSQESARERSERIRLKKERKLGKKGQEKIAKEGDASVSEKKEAEKTEKKPAQVGLGSQAIESEKKIPTPQDATVLENISTDDKKKNEQNQSIKAPGTSTDVKNKNDQPTTSKGNYETSRGKGNYESSRNKGNDPKFNRDKESNPKSGQRGRARRGRNLYPDKNSQISKDSEGNNNFSKPKQEESEKSQPVQGTSKSKPEPTVTSEPTPKTSSNKSNENPTLDKTNDVPAPTNPKKRVVKKIIRVRKPKNGEEGEQEKSVGESGNKTTPKAQEKDGTVKKVDRKPEVRKTEARPRESGPGPAKVNSTAGPSTSESTKDNDAAGRPGRKARPDIQIYRPGSLRQASNSKNIPKDKERDQQETKSSSSKVERGSEPTPSTKPKKGNGNGNGNRSKISGTSSSDVKKE